jgi:hypothetical protein
MTMAALAGTIIIRRHLRRQEEPHNNRSNTMETYTNISSQQSPQGNDAFVKLDAIPLAAPPPEPQPQPAELPPPVFTNEQFCELIAPLVYDAACGDLPPEALEQMPSPKLLKIALDLIQFDKASGLLEGMVNMDPKKTLIVGLIMTGAWSAWVVVKAQALRAKLKKSGQYEAARKAALEQKKKEYEELLKMMQQQSQAQETQEKGDEHGSQDRDQGGHPGQ